MKLSRAMEKYMVYCAKTRKMSVNTIRNYEHAVRRFVEHMSKAYGISRAEDVSKGNILEYQQNLNMDYAPSSAVQHYTIIHVFFNFMEDYNIIEDSPFRRIHSRKLKIPKRMPTTLTIEEMRDMLTAAYLDKPELYFGSMAAEDMVHYRDCFILEVLFNTGMRVNELCSLKIKDYDVKNGIIQLIGKGDKERRCYITEAHIPNLYERYMEERKQFLKSKGFVSQHILINRFGKNLSTQGVRNLVAKYSKAAGIEKNVTPHVFRHSFATLLLEQGVNLRYIQEYLGHETILTTQRYLHISDKAARKTLTEHHPRKLIRPEMFDLDC